MYFCSSNTGNHRKIKGVIPLCSVSKNVAKKVPQMNRTEYLPKYLGSYLEIGKCCDVAGFLQMKIGNFGNLEYSELV